MAAQVHTDPGQRWRLYGGGHADLFRAQTQTLREMGEEDADWVNQLTFLATQLVLQQEGV